MILLPNQLFFAEVEAMLAEGREVQIRMKGHSMRPLLRSERDRVVLAPCTDPARLQPGDVVLFRCCGRHILHRIVRRGRRKLPHHGTVHDARRHRRCHTGYPRLGPHRRLRLPRLAAPLAPLARDPALAAAAGAARALAFGLEMKKAGL